MRIVAGERRSIPLKSATGQLTRPTTDKVKESLFNIIGPFFDGGVVLDLFAGSGGLGLEALSRGMTKAIFIEKDPKAVAMIKENIAKCRYEDRIELYRNDATRAIATLVSRNEQFDIVFVDPPYAKEMYYSLIEPLIEAGKVADDGYIVCEHDKRLALAEAYGSFTLLRQQTYGDTVISIYTKGE